MGAGSSTKLNNIVDDSHDSHDESILYLQNQTRSDNNISYSVDRVSLSLNSYSFTDDKSTSTEYETTCLDDEKFNEEYIEDKPVKNRRRPTVIMGPSGIGKGTLIRAMHRLYPNRFEVVVSHTTRDKRAGEQNGVHYYFVNESEFQDSNKFIELGKIHGNWYGTSKKAVNDVLDQGKICILEINITAAQKIKKGTSFDCNYIFITAKDVFTTIKQRLVKRNSENSAQMKKRLATACDEIKFLQENKKFFDEVISNDNLQESISTLSSIFEEWYPEIIQYRTNEEDQINNILY